jgi:hypothetical protein
MSPFFALGTLADLEDRPQLLVAEGRGGSQEVAVHPSPVLMKALKNLDCVHVHPFRPSGGSKPAPDLVRGLLLARPLPLFASRLVGMLELTGAALVNEPAKCQQVAANRNIVAKPRDRQLLH